MNFISVHFWNRSTESPYLSLFSSAWYTLSQESGTFWLLQGRLLLLLMLFLRAKLLLRTDWLLLAPLLLEALFPDTQPVNCFRGAPSDMRESIFQSLSRGGVSPALWQCQHIGLHTGVFILSTSWTNVRLLLIYTRNEAFICKYKEHQLCQRRITSTFINSIILSCCFHFFKVPYTAVFLFSNVGTF